VPKLERIVTSVCVLALAAGSAGCGSSGDKKPSPAQPGAGQPQHTQTAPKPGTPPATSTSGETSPRGGSPEDQPGGAGDEEPIRTPALFKGVAGRVTPSKVRVPPFVSIQVVLESADAGDYGLTVGGQTLRVTGAKRQASALLDGLRPDKSYRGKVDGGGAVTIVASAEPGP
jgi:hypothetical protein